MKFVLMQNQQQVITGPMPWSVGMFTHGLEKLGIANTALPQTLDGYLLIQPGIEIFPVTMTDPSYDTLTQQLVGPYYTVVGQTVNVTFNIVPASMDMVRGKLYDKAAALRVTKENAGASVTVEGQMVMVPTDKASRTQFTAAVPGNVWKFNQTQWAVLSATDIQTIQSAVAAVVQGAYNWEYSVFQQISAAPDIATLAAIVIK